MILYKGYKTFSILGEEINIIYDDEADYPISVAEIKNQIYYVGGSEGGNITSAIFAWQEFNARELTAEELRQILTDNGILSQPLE